MTSKPRDSKRTKPDGHGDGRGRHRTRSSTKEFASRKTNGVCSRRATRRMLQANGGSMDTTRMTSSITTSRQPWTEWRSSVLSSSTGTYNSGGGELLHRLSEERRSGFREGHTDTLPASVSTVDFSTAAYMERVNYPGMQEYSHYTATL